MSELPSDWALADGSQLFEILRGVSYKKHEAQNTPFDDSVAILRAGNLQDGSIIFEDLVYVPEEHATSNQRLKNGDIVIALSSGSKAIVGKTANAESDLPNFSFGAFCGLIRPYSSNIKAWVKWYFRTSSYRKHISELSSGVNINNIKPVHLNELKIPVPPANEQKRIVKKLEACEGRINTAREALDEVPSLLDQYRQSVLAAAFRGDLTKKWRQQNPDVEPASKLLAHLRQERRQKWEEAELAKYQAKDKTPPKDWKKRYKEPNPPNQSDLPEIPSGWRWETLYALVEEGNIFDGPFGSKLKTKDYTDTGVRVVRLENLAPLRFIEEKQSFVSEEKYEDLKRHEVFEGDIFFSSFIFDQLRVCQLPKLNTKAIAKADCLCVRSTFSGINPLYLAMALASPSTKALISDDVHGATRPRINTEQLRSVVIPVPPASEQQMICDTISRSWNLAESLAIVQSDSVNDLDTLTDRVLQKAFKGELVPQDPNDEPASKLLDRIKELKESTPKLKRATKKARNKKLMKIQLEEALANARSDLTPNDLFSLSGYKPEEVEEFYADLKKAIDSKSILEDRSDEQNPKLRLAKAS